MMKNLSAIKLFYFGIIGSIAGLLFWGTIEVVQNFITPNSNLVKISDATLVLFFGLEFVILLYYGQKFFTKITCEPIKIEPLSKTIGSILIIGIGGGLISVYLSFNHLISLIIFGIMSENIVRVFIIICTVYLMLKFVLENFHFKQISVAVLLFLLSYSQINSTFDEPILEWLFYGATIGIIPAFFEFVKYK